MIKKLLFCLAIFIYMPFFAQYHISGIVTNKETQEPLAFVYITLNGDSSQGAISDIDGRFDLYAAEEITSISLSYIGFETKTIHINDKDFLTISLKPYADELNEVVISTKNPALAIIKKVIAHREENNPNNLNEYSHDSYNKTIFDIISENKKLDSMYNSVIHLMKKLLGPLTKI